MNKSFKGSACDDANLEAEAMKLFYSRHNIGAAPNRNG
jgi:hypothetical protein